MLAAAAAFIGCDAKTALLEAVDPDIINPSSVQSAAARSPYATARSQRLRAATADDESTWLFGGLLVDEWATSSTFVQNDETDQRQTKLDNGTVQSELRALYRVRTVGKSSHPVAEQVQTDTGLGHRRDVLRARFRRAAAGVGLLQRDSADRRRR